MLIVLLLLCASLLSPSILAQADSDYIAYPNSYRPWKHFSGDTRQLTFNRFPGLSADYRLDTGDSIQIHVVGLPVFDQTLRISNTGEVDFPLLGAIRVAGFSCEELEQELASRLTGEELVQEPEVLVYISEYGAKPIYVLGQVDRPGQFMMSQQLTLMDAIFMAGGLDFPAARYGYLHRRASPGEPGSPEIASLEHPELAKPGREVIRVDLQPMKEGGVLERNIPLQKGDVFIVPKRDLRFFYVVGEVRRPGAFELPPEQAVFASQAISSAGGPSQTAKLGKSLLVRHTKDGQRSEISLDFGDILKGKQEDVRMEADDIVFVPGSNAKTIGYSVLGAVPHVVRNALIYGVFF
jgi:polysaccharide biosynthesis/export protein